MHITLRVCILTLLLSSLFIWTNSYEASPACTYSSLWGVNGEKWSPTGRLPDFAYAGYQAGEAKLPNSRPKWDLKRDFHAKGDGTSDDSGALLKAIQTIKSGVL